MTVREVFTGVRWYLREVSGESAYDRYVEHRRREHPDEPVMIAPRRSSAGARTSARPGRRLAVAEARRGVPVRRRGALALERARRRRRPPLDYDELVGLSGLGEPVALDEVNEVYLPLARLLELRIAAARELSAPPRARSCTRRRTPCRS